MDDLISRRSAIDALKGCYCGGEDSCGEPWIYESHAIKAIEQLQTQPKKGKWIMTNVGDTFMTDAPKIIYCSSCNVCAPYATNYCPHCGADMREVTT